MIGLAFSLLGVALPKWLAPWMKWAIDIALIALALLSLYALHGHWERSAYNRAYNEGWNALAAKDAAASAKAAAVNVKATATADTERTIDTTNIATDKEARDVAIKTAPASATGAATRAANCVRWARSHPGAATPAACR